MNKEKLEEAKRLYETANADQRYVLERLFPELAESEDEKMFKDTIRFCEICGNQVSANWLKFLKGRISSKQEWSGGDEAHLHSLITHLEQWIESNPDTTGADIQGENIAWLKSLKDRYTWKPSDEQMKALYDSIPENVMEISEREMLLNELYKDLKKL